MTKLAKTIEQLRKQLPLVGFTQDAYGHFQKPSHTTNRLTGERKPVQIRVKIQTTSVRIETKHEGDSGWFKVISAFLRDVEFREDGSVKIGKFIFTVSNGTTQGESK